MTCEMEKNGGLAYAAEILDGVNLLFDALIEKANGEEPIKPSELTALQAAVRQATAFVDETWDDED